MKHYFLRRRKIIFLFFSVFFYTFLFAELSFSDKLNEILINIRNYRDIEFAQKNLEEIINAGNISREEKVRAYIWLAFFSYIRGHEDKSQKIIKEVLSKYYYGIILHRDFWPKSFIDFFEKIKNRFAVVNLALPFSDAKVFIDGKELEDLGNSKGSDGKIKIVLEEGTHKIIALSENYLTKKEIRLRGGEKVLIEMQIPKEEVSFVVTPNVKNFEFFIDDLPVNIKKYDYKIFFNDEKFKITIKSELGHYEAILSPKGYSRFIVNLSISTRDTKVLAEKESKDGNKQAKLDEKYSHSQSTDTAISKAERIEKEVVVESKEGEEYFSKGKIREEEKIAKLDVQPVTGKKAILIDTLPPSNVYLEVRGDKRKLGQTPISIFFEDVLGNAIWVESPGYVGRTIRLRKYEENIKINLMPISEYENFIRIKEEERKAFSTKELISILKAYYSIGSSLGNERKYEPLILAIARVMLKLLYIEGGEKWESKLELLKNELKEFDYDLYIYSFLRVIEGFYSFDRCRNSLSLEGLRFCKSVVDLLSNVRKVFFSKEIPQEYADISIAELMNVVIARAYEIAGCIKKKEGLDYSKEVREAKSIWENSDFLPIPNPKNPLQPFDNPYSKLKDVHLSYLENDEPCILE